MAGKGGPARGHVQARLSLVQHPTTEHTPDALDTIDTMEEYRNQVALHPGGARKAREAATALLVSWLFFELDSLPDCDTTPLWCYGTIHCKRPSQQVMDALHRLRPGDWT